MERKRKKKGESQPDRPRSLQMQKVDDDMEDYEYVDDSYRRQEDEARSRRRVDDDNRSRRRNDGDGSRRRDDLAGFGMREDVEKKLRARQLAEEQGRESRSRR